MKVYSFILLIFCLLCSVRGDTYDVRIKPSHYISGFLAYGQVILGSEDQRWGGGISYGYGRPEPRFQCGKIPAQLVYELYADHTQSHGLGRWGQNSTFALGSVAFARWRWPLDKQGNGIYVDLGWGLQVADKPTLNLDSMLNSTPMGGIGGTYGFGDKEFIVGVRFLHASNAGLKGHNRGDNQLLFTMGFRY